MAWLRRLLVFVLSCAVFVVASWASFVFFVRGRSLQAPDLVGKPAQEAARIAQEAGLDMVVERHRERFDEKIAMGHVLEQRPKAGSGIKSGRNLRVALSKGPLILAIPKLEGGTLRTAQLMLNRMGLEVGVVSYGRGLAAENRILAHEPPAGVVVQRETPVNLLISEGEPETAYVMPDLIQHEYLAVRSFFAKHGFRVGNVKYEPYEGVAGNLVLRQFPLPGYPLRSGEPITLVVSRPDSPEMPEGAAATATPTPLPLLVTPVPPVTPVTP